MEFFLCEQNQAFGVFYAEVQAIPGNCTFFDCKMKQKISLSPPLVASCLSPSEGPSQGPPQIPFCCCIRQRDRPSLKLTDRRHLHPSWFTGCSSPLPWSTAHSHRTHHRGFIKTCLHGPTLVPSNNHGTLSISDICPQSSSF